MKNNTVIITGGAGYVGSHICKALHEEGYQIIVIDNFSQGHEWAIKWGTHELCDIRDFSRLESIMRHYSPIAVVHCAALIEVAESMIKPLEYYDVNVNGTLTLLKAMVETKVNNIIFSSSAAVYGDSGKEVIDENTDLCPINVYGNTKYIAETIIKDANRAGLINYISLRYFNAAGADYKSGIGEAHKHESHAIPLLLQAIKYNKTFNVNGNNYPTKDGTCIRDFVHVSDIADAHIKAIKYLLSDNPQSQSINLGSSQGCSIMDLINMAEHITKTKVDYKISANRIGDPVYLVSSNELAKSILGWHPTKTLQDIVESAWEWIEIFN